MTKDPDHILDANSSRRLHVLAVVAVCLALGLTAFSGAIVTTKNAGMAFPDYPTSDGHSMLTYPWLRSVGDKFLEHGHRLAGMVIGISSVAMAVMAWFTEQRRWVRVWSGGILLGVIAQGLLGGQRVLLDSRGLAFVHGSFAALVISAMIVLATVTSRGWLQALQVSDWKSLRGMTEINGWSKGETAARDQGLRRVRWSGWLLVAAVFVQYVLGGFVRHRGTALYEHLGMAGVVACGVTALAYLVFAENVKWLKRPACCLVGLLLLQVGLGLATWVHKFGFEGLVDVVVQGSTLQVVLRTSHVLTGMGLLFTAVVIGLRASRLVWCVRRGGQEGAGRGQGFHFAEKAAPAEIAMLPWGGETG